jgi:hypothetical protein
VTALLEQEWLAGAARRDELYNLARRHGDGTQEHARLMREDSEVCDRLLVVVGPALRAAGVDPCALKPQMELFDAA